MSDTPTGATASTLENDLAALRDDVARLTDTLSTLASDTATTARNAAETAATHARERVETAADDLSETIVENPLTAVLIALGVGYLVGVIGRRR